MAKEYTESHLYEVTLPQDRNRKESIYLIKLNNPGTFFPESDFISERFIATGNHEECVESSLVCGGESIDCYKSYTATSYDEYEEIGQLIVITKVTFAEALEKNIPRAH